MNKYYEKNKEMILEKARQRKKIKSQIPIDKDIKDRLNEILKLSVFKSYSEIINDLINGVLISIDKDVKDKLDNILRHSRRYRGYNDIIKDLINAVYEDVDDDKQQTGDS